MVIVFSSLVVTMLFLFSILSSYDKTICNSNLCRVQTNVISTALYVNAAPEGNYTSNPSDQEKDEDEIGENGSPPEEEPETAADEVSPYTPPRNENDDDNDDRNNGKHKSQGDDNNGADDNNDGIDNNDGDTTRATLSDSNEAIKPSMAAVSNASNVTQTATGGNPIFDALKNIFGSIVGSSP